MKDYNIFYSTLQSNLRLENVTTEGLEPSTNRAEICHSIQLNYVANLLSQQN